MRYNQPPIRLTKQQWGEILERIKTEYADTPSVFMMRPRMRSVLGFLPREIAVKRHSDGAWWDVDMMIEIDFFGDEDANRAWFILKYL